LTEWFAILTDGRRPARLTPAIAAEMVEVNLPQRLNLVSLTSSEYAAVFQAAASVGARGGAIYAMLLLAAARKCRAERIHTLNLRHFSAFAPDLREQLHQE
jgi:hypothetical protein